MSTYSLSHLADGVLLRDLATLVAQDRATTAKLLAHLAEVDARKLYLAAAYPSMYLYCVGELRLSEEAAFKRIHAARTARRFPAIFAAVADGRLHLSAVIMLAPHLTPDTANELLAAAAHKTKSEIEQLVAQRFPRPDVPARIEAIALPPAPMLPDEAQAPGPVGADQHAPGRVAAAAPRPKVAPLAPERYAVQFTIGQRGHDKLRYAQALLSHQVPSGDIAAVLERALDVLIEKLEQGKFAKTEKPSPRPRRSHPSGRHVPADVRRRVWERDGGQCTFVGDNGQRCPARAFLEFDHIDEVARGGQSTVSKMRLRCRAHNQYGAECAFGTGFMSHKRQVARRRTEEARARVAEAGKTRAQAAAADEAPAEAKARTQAAEARASASTAAEHAWAKANEVVPWLRALGFRADEARRAAVLCETIPDASLEERVRVALSCFRPRVPANRMERANCVGTAAC